MPARLAVVSCLIVRASALPTEVKRAFEDITGLELEQAEQALFSDKALSSDPKLHAPLHARRTLLSWSTEYCYLTSTGDLDAVRSLGCVAEPASAPACAVGASPTPESMCSLGANVRGVDENRWFDTYAFDHCEQAVVYVSVDETERYYCKGGLQTTGDWSTRRRASVAPNQPESTGDSGWSCWWRSGYEWHDGKCRARERYLGEVCWDDAGECQNEGHAAYSGRHLSCATVPELGITTPTCIPSAFDIERNSCTCNWFDWYFGVACGASQCNGHACVWSTGPGGWTCDYNTDNNW